MRATVVLSGAGDIIRRDCRGTVLRYPDPTVRRLFHEAPGSGIADRDRCKIVAAERAVRILEIITDHVDLSSLALTRIEIACQDIRAGLAVRRAQLEKEATR